jgi:hypothetical protein
LSVTLRVVYSAIITSDMMASAMSTSMSVKAARRARADHIGGSGGGWPRRRRWRLLLLVEDARQEALQQELLALLALERRPVMLSFTRRTRCCESGRRRRPGRGPRPCGTPVVKDEVVLSSCSWRRLVVVLLLDHAGRWRGRSPRP